MKKISFWDLFISRFPDYSIIVSCYNEYPDGFREAFDNFNFSLDRCELLQQDRFWLYLYDFCVIRTTLKICHVSKIILLELDYSSDFDEDHPEALSND